MAPVDAPHSKEPSRCSDAAMDHPSSCLCKNYNNISRYLLNFAKVTRQTISYGQTSTARLVSAPMTSQNCCLQQKYPQLQHPHNRSSHQTPESWRALSFHQPRHKFLQILLESSGAVASVCFCGRYITDVNDEDLKSQIQALIRKRSPEQQNRKLWNLQLFGLALSNWMPCCHVLSSTIYKGTQENRTHNEHSTRPHPPTYSLFHGRAGPPGQQDRDQTPS